MTANRGEYTIDLLCLRKCALVLRGACSSVSVMLVVLVNTHLPLSTAMFTTPTFSFVFPFSVFGSRAKNILDLQNCGIMRLWLVMKNKLNFLILRALNTTLFGLMKNNHFLYQITLCIGRLTSFKFYWLYLPSRLNVTRLNFLAKITSTPLRPTLIRLT